MSVAPPPGGTFAGNPWTRGQDALTVGSTTFYTIEEPQELPIGALEQRVVVQEQVGGGRDVQVLGVQPKPVTWIGKFVQPMMDADILNLQQMTVAGKAVALKWKTQQFMGIIKDFTPKFHHANYAEYEITIEITMATNGLFGPPVGSGGAGGSGSSGGKARWVGPLVPFQAGSGLDQQVQNLGNNLSNQSGALGGVDPSF